jgi:hypothetical protein
MASTKDNATPDKDQGSVQTDTGEPIAVDSKVEKTPLQEEQEEIARTAVGGDVDDDGIHRGVTGPPAGANNTVDDGNDPNRPNITPLGRDVKYPHEVPGMDGSHVVTVEEEEKREDRIPASTKSVSVNKDRDARTEARDTPGTKR